MDQQAQQAQQQPAAGPADPYAEARMTVLEHLVELRQRVVKSMIAVALCFAVSWIWIEQIFAFLQMPLAETGKDALLTQMHHKDLSEPFFVLLKTGMFAGVFFAAPVILYQLWSFIAPALYPDEKKVAIPFVILATIFFVVGSGFCFYVVMPLGYDFLLTFSEGVSKPELMMNEYLALTTKLLLGFGFIFELPVFAMFLARVGVITHLTLLKYWRHSVVIAFILAAMLTPPDIATQTLMAGPLVGLYFISIGVAWYFTKQREKRLRKEAAELDD